MISCLFFKRHVEIKTSDNISDIYKKFSFKYSSKSSLVGIYNNYYTYHNFYILWKAYDKFCLENVSG